MVQATVTAIVVTVSEFEAIARDYGNLLLSTARLLVDDESTAEDVVQSSLELAWRNLASLRDRSAMKAWLVKIVMNQAMSVRRREVRSATYLRKYARMPLMRMSRRPSPPRLPRRWNAAGSARGHSRATHRAARRDRVTLLFGYEHPRNRRHDGDFAQHHQETSGGGPPPFA